MLHSALRPGLNRKRTAMLPTFFESRTQGPLYQGPRGVVLGCVLLACLLLIVVRCALFLRQEQQSLTGYGGAQVGMVTRFVQLPHFSNGPAQKPVSSFHTTDGRGQQEAPFTLLSKYPDLASLCLVQEEGSLLKDFLTKKNLMELGERELCGVFAITFAGCGTSNCKAAGFVTVTVKRNKESPKIKSLEFHIAITGVERQNEGHIRKAVEGGIDGFLEVNEIKKKKLESKFLIKFLEEARDPETWLCFSLLNKQGLIITVSGEKLNEETIREDQLGNAISLALERGRSSSLKEAISEIFNQKHGSLSISKTSHAH